MEEIQESNDPNWEMGPQQMESTPDCLVIKLFKEEFDRLCKSWKKVSIIKHLGGNLGYIGLSRWITQEWKLSGEKVMTDVGNNFYVVHFTRDDNNDRLFTAYLG